jgi:hypothetical protein
LHPVEQAVQTPLWLNSPSGQVEEQEFPLRTNSSAQVEHFAALEQVEQFSEQGWHLLLVSLYWLAPQMFVQVVPLSSNPVAQAWHWLSRDPVQVEQAPLQT